MKIYFDKNIIKKYNKEWIPFLYPILGLPKHVDPDNTGFYDKKQINEWLKIGNNYLTNTDDIEQSDYIVFPVDFKIDYLKTLEKLCELGNQYNKKIIVFYYNDCEYPIPNRYKNIIVFRTSLNRGNPHNEFSMPGFCEDIGASYGISKEIPGLSIGYTGYAGYHDIKSFFKFIFNKIKLFLFDNQKFYYFLIVNKQISKIGKYLQKKGKIKDGSFFRNSLLYVTTIDGKGSLFRNKVISTIQHGSIKFNFIERHGMLNNKASYNLREEYINNLKKCLFPLVIRGNGNYSYRLYEAMSLGKIPIFIDTNCVLPFENKINYKDLFIYVPFDDIRNLENYVNDFIKENGDNINLLGGKIRDVYEEYCTLTGFYKHIIMNLSNNVY